MIIIAGIFVFLLVLEMIREVHTFVVTHYCITTGKLAEKSGILRVAVLSDLHNCTYGKKNEKLLEAIKNERPDFILVAGDMLVGKKGASFAVAEAFMREAVRIAPVFYGNGNHEQRMKEEPEYYGDAYERYKHILLESGVTLLENGSGWYKWKDEKIRMTGFEISPSYYKKFSRKKLTLSEMEGEIGEADRLSFQILLAHNPMYGETYEKWGADLTVSGHLHGGIVRCPFLGGVITPQAKLFPKYYGGNYQIGEMALIVSRGLGTHTFPIRLFNTPELVMIEIKGTK